MGSPFDFDCYGLVQSPRLVDLNLTAGMVTMKNPSLVRLYEQMPELNYVVVMGASTVTRGMLVPILIILDKGVDFHYRIYMVRHVQAGASSDSVDGEGPSWAPLCDNYMLTNSKLKDWDKTQVGFPANISPFEFC